MAASVTVPAAAAAGLLSFLSPCVLPLVPPYLTYLAGTSIEELADGGESRARRDTLFAALLFVAGFSTVFVALGASASVVGQVVNANRDILSVLAGVAIIAMGLHFLGAFRLAFLYREKRLEVSKPVGLWGAYIMGLAFAFGWTPCIGPILGTILTVAGTEGTAASGAALLAVYSLGLGIPFLLAAIGMQPFIAFMKRFRVYFGVLEKTVGGLLVLTGAIFLFGGMTTTSQWLLETFPALARLG